MGKSFQLWKLLVKLRQSTAGKKLVEPPQSAPQRFAVASKYPYKLTRDIWNMRPM